MTALEFLTKFTDGYRIVSTGALTDLQISEARVEDRLWVNQFNGYGYVALPWELSTVKDKEREIALLAKRGTSNETS